MTHSISLQPWQHQHFRSNDKCLLLLPVPPQPDVSGEYSTNHDESGRVSIRMDGCWMTWTCPYQPGDVLDFGDFRKLVVSETAKMAGDLTEADAQGNGIKLPFSSESPSREIWLWAIELEDAT